MRVRYYYDHNQFKKTVTCPHCGKRFWNHGWSMTPLAQYAKEHGLCLECAKWVELSEHRPDELEIVDGIAYRVFPMSEKIYGGYLGGEGKIKCVLHHDGSSRVSNDVWTIGQIPERFIHLFPNTGWWVPEKYAKRLQRGVLHCHGKMCFDRYHCFRYDYTQEYKEGPYNAVPKDWIAGSENCRQFINILEITNYFQYNYEIQSLQNDRGDANDKSGSREEAK